MNYSSENETNHEHKYTGYYDRRRTIRIKRSGLRRSELEQLDRPALKFAETNDELEQLFRLVYEVYRQKNLVSHNDNGMLYNIYSLLPSTTHVIAKSYQDVISNLTEIFDNKYFGLPMDELYKEELDVLRNEGRNVTELSALATPKEHRWKNIFHYLVQVVYWYSFYTNVDDICISINPRHVRYYMYIFPFERFGPERYYERVGAPAIGLRVKVKEIVDRMQEICNDLNFDTSLLDYFKRINDGVSQHDISEVETNNQEIVFHKRLNTQIVKYFVQLNPQILSELDKQQKDKFSEYYPGLHLPDF